MDIVTVTVWHRAMDGTPRKIGRVTSNGEGAARVGRRLRRMLDDMDVRIIYAGKVQTPADGDMYTLGVFAQFRRGSMVFATLADS